MCLSHERTTVILHRSAQSLGRVVENARAVRDVSQPGDHSGAMSGTEPVRVSKQAARRFVLGKQGLWPGRRWAAKAGTADAVVACEHLQLDPLVIVARSHDLVLHARVVGCQAEFFDALAYDELCFFDWDGWLAVRAMAQLPYWRSLMRRHREQPRMVGMVDRFGAAIDAMRTLLAERVSLASCDFKKAHRRAIVSYRGTKDSSLILYYLWLVGDAMTHHRDRFERVYALTEAVAPAHLIREAPNVETDRFMARKAVAFAGIGTPGPLSRLLCRTVHKPEERATEDGLVESGDLARIEVDGWPGRYFMVTQDVCLLDDVASGRVPASSDSIETTTEDEVMLWSPLDPTIERRRAKALFEFDYVWEIYKRAEHVAVGRYAMPILWGDRFVGRIDLRTDRRSHTLVVNGIWLEDATLARVPQFRDALRAGLQRMLAFLQTEELNAATTETQIWRAITARNPRRRAPRR